jgi:uncharacterized protein YwgA
MKKTPRASIILSLISSLRDRSSWCGETNIQKATFFLQELAGVPLDFDFVLYKYGPYCFDLTDELTAMRANSILTLQIRDPRYGPCYVPGELSGTLLEHYPKTTSRFRREIDFVAERLGTKGVTELERLATALYVERKLSVDAQKRADKIIELKPHISRSDALAAVQEVDQMIDEARQLLAEVS